MGGPDENKNVGPMNLQGGIRGGRTRRALSNINKNIIGAPFYPCADNKNLSPREVRYVTRRSYLMEALEGKYVEPGPGGDLIRNPKVLPTGKNIHALDPQAVPTTAAMGSAKIVVDSLVERQKLENEGKYPETIALSLRKDNKKPSAYIADTTTANAQVRTLSETVRLDARTKLRNPKWYEGMMSSGYEGVREIEKRLANTVGWNATSGQVDNWVYEEANTTFIKAEEMLNRLMNTNPNSFRKMIQTFLEANGRVYWETSEDNIEKLKDLYSQVEDKIEGIHR